ncbi:helix-turn-helix domain-containing protein [Paraburkholderia tropica]|nr:helix-turn-helix domain-containing protein [Paraburkholderia tropica]
MAGGWLNMADAGLQQLSPDATPRANAGRHRAKKIGIVVCDGFALLPVGAVVEILHLANRVRAGGATAELPYDVRLLSVHGGVVRSASSIGLQTARAEPPAHAEAFHAVFVATGDPAREDAAQEPASTALNRFVGLADKVFAIADGEAHDKALDRAHEEAARPAWLRAQVARTMAEHDGIERSGAAMSPVELALALVEADLGAAIAQDIGRRASQPLRWQFCSLAGKRSVAALSQQIQRAAHWLETNATRDISTDDAAKFASMSNRNFQRRFKAETGVTPSDYLQQTRIELCCKMLADTRLPVDKIARRCGLRGGAQLSKLLRRRLNTTPTDYRAQMQASHKG